MFIKCTHVLSLLVLVSLT